MQAAAHHQRRRRQAGGQRAGRKRASRGEPRIAVGNEPRRQRRRERDRAGQTQWTGKLEDRLDGALEIVVGLGIDHEEDRARTRQGGDAVGEPSGTHDVLAEHFGAAATLARDHGRDRRFRPCALGIGGELGGREQAPTEPLLTAACHAPCRRDRREQEDGHRSQAVERGVELGARA